MDNSELTALTLQNFTKTCGITSIPIYMKIHMRDCTHLKRISLHINRKEISNKTWRQTRNTRFIPDSYFCTSCDFKRLFNWGPLSHVLWEAALCRSVCLLHIHLLCHAVQHAILHVWTSEDDESTILWNVGNYKPDDTAYTTDDLNLHHHRCVILNTRRTVKLRVKVKANFALEKTMKAQLGSKSTALLFVEPRS